jgi:hypothetical protein
MNVVMTGAGHFVEVQGTAEGEPFTREQMAKLMDLAAKGISELVALQRAALAGTRPEKPQVVRGYAWRITNRPQKFPAGSRASIVVS